MSGKSDYIRREDVVTWLRDKADEPKNQERFCTFEVACVELADEIELGPYLHPGVPKSADVRENVRGEWVIDEDDIKYGNSLKKIRCSNCGKRPYFNKEERKFVLADYCHHCGADMRGERIE